MLRVFRGRDRQGSRKMYSRSLSFPLSFSDDLRHEYLLEWTVGLCDRAVVARFVIVLAYPKVVRLYRSYLRFRTVV